MEIKKIIAVGLIICASTISVKVYAQSKMSQEKKIERITKKMAQRLKLTNEQQAKVYEINLARAIGHQKAYDSGRKKEMILQIVQKWKEDLKGVLTEKQQRRLKI